MTGAALDTVDRELVERAVRLGREGWGRVHPNPMVGCVVARGGEVVGEGFHREFGGPHAEVLALEEAGARAEGSTVYVSLEPCRHVGKTPACTGAIRRAGVVRVVYGANDVTVGAGGGADELRDAGLDVVGPVLSVHRAREENAAFFHNALNPEPFVALKLAVSLDGAISRGPGVRTQITGAPANRAVHALRAGFDAVLVGSGTAAIDDPRLTVRHDVPLRKQPARIVLDSELTLGTDAALFRDLPSAPLLIFTREDASEEAMERLEEAGANVHPVAPAPGGRDVDLGAVLAVCSEIGLTAILCEGGARLASALLDEDRVERLHMLVAPIFLGSGGTAAFTRQRVGEGIARPSMGGSAASDRGGDPTRGPESASGTEESRPVRAAVAWRLAGEPRRLGDDVELTYDRVRPWCEGPGALWTPVVTAPESP